MTLTLQDKNYKTIGAAHNLELYGTTPMSSSTSTNGWRAGAVVPFVYDGENQNWIRFFWENSTYTVTSVWCNTAADTAAKVSSNASYYAIRAGNIFEITFRYSNTAKDALTLNINSTGTKPLYINGEPSSASNYTLPAGKYIVYYDGTNYYINTGGLAPISISGNAATATKFASDQAITLTGDITGTASSKAGWSISTSINTENLKTKLNLDNKQEKTFIVNFYDRIYDNDYEDGQNRYTMVSSSSEFQAAIQLNSEGKCNLEAQVSSVDSSTLYTNYLKTLMMFSWIHLFYFIHPKGMSNLDELVYEYIACIGNNPSDEQIIRGSVELATTSTIEDMGQELLNFIANNYISKTGGQITGDLTMYTSGTGESPAVIFQRGTLTDSYNDWKIYDKNNYLYFAQRGNASENFSDQIYFDTSGNIHTTNTNGIFDGKIAWNHIIDKPSNYYTLPTASSDVLGGIKVGNGLSINNSFLSHIVPTGASASIKGNQNVGVPEFIKTIETDAFGHIINYSTEALTIYDGSTSSDLEVFDNTLF